VPRGEAAGEEAALRVGVEGTSRRGGRAPGSATPEPKRRLPNVLFRGHGAYGLRVPRDVVSPPGLPFVASAFSQAYTPRSWPSGKRGTAVEESYG
jgi:hypothetical protein